MQEGVPLITWPLFAEQKMNAVLLVDALKVALRPKFNEDGIVDKEEIAKVTKCLMVEEEGIGMRERIKNLKDYAVNALRDGSSTQTLSKLASEWENFGPIGKDPNFEGKDPLGDIEDPMTRSKMEKLKQVLEGLTMKMKEGFRSKFRGCTKMDHFSKRKVHIEDYLTKIGQVHPAKRLSQVHPAVVKLPVETSSSCIRRWCSQTQYDQPESGCLLESVPILNIEYRFDIDTIEAMRVPVNQELEDCDILGYFNLKETIYPVLIRKFYETTKFSKTVITGEVLNTSIRIDIPIIAQAIGCERVKTAYQKKWVSDVGGLTNVGKVIMKEGEKDIILYGKLDDKAKLEPRTASPTWTSLPYSTR
ncbi:hypothetical protein Fmac_011307 [Flemingia macrophylla]|uniref:Uncharacterized protein n=1 Tax=Flemingia macrophylla TaxID=520843 RepID=A0ABD1MM21_9FABA